jgi:hypothetical protein
MWVLALGLGGPGRLLAGSLPDWAANTEVMMEAETAEMTFIGRYLGPDGSSPLPFTTTQDIAARTFSFQLGTSSNPNPTYLGQPMTLVANGSFDTSLDQWVITTHGTFGPSGPGQTTWDSAYTASITGDPTFLIAGTITVPIPGFPLLDIKLSGALLVSVPPPIPLVLVASLLTGQATVATIPVGPTFGVFDFLLSTGAFTVTTGGVFLAGLDPNGGGHDFLVKSSGQVTPIQGGEGTFTATIVPEPSTAVLLGLGMIGMGLTSRRAWRRRGISRSPRKREIEG